MILDMPSCSGCRTCEMACSFKHKGEFIPSISSIKILNKEDESGFRILFVEESDGQAIPCDGCKEFEVPLCIQYCKEGGDLKKILKEFIKNAK